MFRSFLICLSIFALAPVKGGELQLAPPPKPVLNQDDETPFTYCGRVVAVTGETITVKPEGYVCVLHTRAGRDGRAEVVSIYKQDNTKPPRTFVFSDTLLDINGTLPTDRRLLPRGGVGAWERQHKISVVRVGDHVELETHVNTNKVPICASLEILRRYGGQVPTAVGDHIFRPSDKHLRVDVSRNAEQAREEKAFALAARMLRTVAR